MRKRCRRFHPERHKGTRFFDKGGPKYVIVVGEGS
jgi:hypothetical protein